ncbi:PMEI domain-containing protein [Abeliophyllum distichum]|uniref:PMEI domain-containing protein n=1 Tax=Abeliophyllum distichum TaxID=126358 RepID=A0ABD1W126_9LAMI
MMTFQKFNSFSFLLLAIIATIFFHGVAAHSPFCEDMNTEDLCLSMINGATNWHDAVENSIHASLPLAKELQSKNGLIPPATAKLSATAKSLLHDTCKKSFEKVIEMLEGGLVNLAAGENFKLQTRLSLALDPECSDDLSNSSPTFPLTNLVKELIAKLTICVQITAQNVNPE